MAIAQPAIEKILYAEVDLKQTPNGDNGANVWGLQQNFLDANRKYIGKTVTLAQLRGNKPLAIEIWQKVFVGRRFNEINDQDTATFLFDTWFQNQTLYTCLILTLTNRVSEIKDLRNRDIALDNRLIADINASDENLIGQALWMRRRMARIYWGKHLWSGFDKKRFSQHTPPSCLDPNTPNKLLYATYNMVNIGKILLGQPEKQSLERIKQRLESEINLPLYALDNDQIGDPFNQTGCLTRKDDNGNENLMWLLGLGIGIYLLKSL